MPLHPGWMRAATARHAGIAYSRSLTHIPQALEVIDWLLIQQLAQQRVVEAACTIRIMFER
jgi:hypothetical protein